MNPAGSLIDLNGITKAYGAAHPLRLNDLRLDRGDRVTIAGLDRPAAETLLNLITGASVPETGDVIVAGQNTRDIATDTAWLASLDRFGIVTHRAVLMDVVSTAGNLALPITLAIDPMSRETRAAVARLAAEVELDEGRLDVPAGTLTEAERLRLHLARALASRPDVLILEHPTERLEPAEARAAFGRVLDAAATRRGIGWLAVSDDETFSRTAGGARLRLDPRTGRTTGGGFGRGLLRR
jgi:predicted ABC-type transport system involved in lysophospholipase L1 biosynthesis ATPase subunit